MPHKGHGYEGKCISLDAYIIIVSDMFPLDMTRKHTKCTHFRKVHRYNSMHAHFSYPPMKDMVKEGKWIVIYVPLGHDKP